VDQVFQKLTALWEENDRMPMAVRIELTGTCRAHEELGYAPQQWINEIRSAALELGQGDIWIEKVRFLTRPHDRGQHPKITSGPAKEIFFFLDEVTSDPVLLKTIAAPLEKLKKKLPRPLREDGETLCLDDSRWLAENLEKARLMLAMYLKLSKD
jgi:hypothetical protein